MKIGQHTLTEIEDQPRAWHKTLAGIKDKRKAIETILQRCGPANVVFCGAGSSYYLGLSAASFFQKITGRRTCAFPSSELFIFTSPLGHEDSRSFLLVPISRSGRTTETVLAIKSAKASYSSTCLAISCYPDSDMAKVSDLTLVAKGAQEESVVMTKAFTSMLIATQGLGYLAVSRPLDPLQVLPAAVERSLAEAHALVKSLLSEAQYERYVYLGAGPLYGLAQEGMLKMKEMALEASEAFHPLEFRHGPKAIITERTLIVLLLSDSGKKYETSLVRDLKPLGARFLIVGEEIPDKLKEASNYCLELSSGLGEYDRLPLYLPALQLLGWEAAIRKGVNPDRPRHLDHVVDLSNPDGCE